MLGYRNLTIISVTELSWQVICQQKYYRCKRINSMITFIVGDKKAYVANEKFHAEGIKGMMKVAKNTDIEIVVEPKFHHIIANYINFMHNTPNNITTVNELIAAFDMNTFFIDDNYFEFLIQQLLNFNPVDLASLLNHYENNNVYLARDIEVHLPFNLVAEDFKLSPAFVKEWLKTEGNKKVLMENGNKLIDSQEYDYINLPKITFNQVSEVSGKIIGDIYLPYPRSIRITITQNGEVKPHKFVYDFYPDYKLKGERSEIDGDGLYREWYINDQLSIKQKYRDREEENQTWYDNGQPKSDFYYKDRKLEGHWQEFTRQGVLKASGSYHRGKREGEWYEYYPDKDEYSYMNYYGGKLNGLYERFNSNGLLLEASNYENDIKQDNW